MKRTIALLLPLAGILGATLWLLRERATAPGESPAAADETRAPADVRRVDEAKLREVNAVVAEKNRAVSREREAFEKDGWKFVDVPPPDARVVGYDPALLAQGRENDLKMQLHSTIPSPDQAAQVAEIAKKAKQEETRYAAVQAIGRLESPKAVDALYDLLLNGGLDPNDDARKEIPSLLRPAALDDPQAQKIAMLLDSPALTTVEKKQIAFTLTLLGLRDGVTLDAKTISALSPQARALLDSMVAVAQNAFLTTHLHINPEKQGGPQ